MRTVPIEWLTDRDAFASAVKAKMKTDGVCTKHLSQMANLGHMAVHDILSGRSSPRGQTIAAIAEAIGLIEEVTAPSASDGPKLRAWRATRKAWMWAGAALAVAADLLGVADFIRG